MISLRLNAFWKNMQGLRLAAIYCLFFHSIAFGVEGISVPDGLAEIEIFPYAYQVDKTRKQSIDSIRSDVKSWIPASSSRLGFGFSSDVYWVKFKLDFETIDATDYYLQVSYPHHDHLTLYLPEASGGYQEVHAGDHFRFDKRTVKTRRFLFDLKPENLGNAPIYLKIDSGSSMKIGLKLLSTDRAIELTQNETAMFFLFYGSMLAMILYNLLLYISVKEKSYLYYVFYLINHGFFQMAFAGHFFEYILPDYPATAEKALPIFVGGTVLGIGMFTISFLETARFNPRLNVIIKAMNAVSLLLIVATFFLPFKITISFASLLALVFPLICFTVAGIRAKDGSKPALIYILAFTFYFIGVVLSSSATLGFIKSTILTEYSAQIGAFFEIILLSIALGEKINLERKRHYLAIQENLKLSKEREHSYEQLAKVVYPHQVLQIQKGVSYEGTMPTGIHDACILSFDVIDSSKVKTEGFSELIEEFLVECRNLMMVGYDEINLKSNAYMIKEMGDGFLCSVGYPFTQLGPSKAVCAVDLALEIIRRFDAINDRLEAPRRVHCCIGIAMGKVNAYFTKSGSIKHDMWGRPIVLATRYEGIRKQLAQKLELKPANLLILQELVYNSLPNEKRRSFSVYDLKEYGLVVRDDPDAERIIVQELDEAA